MVSGPQNISKEIATAIDANSLQTAALVSELDRLFRGTAQLDNKLSSFGTKIAPLEQLFAAKTRGINLKPLIDRLKKWSDWFRKRIFGDEDVIDAAEDVVEDVLFPGHIEAYANIVQSVNDRFNASLSETNNLLERLKTDKPINQQALEQLRSRSGEIGQQLEQLNETRKILEDYAELNPSFIEFSGFSTSDLSKLLASTKELADKISSKKQEIDQLVNETDKLLEPGPRPPKNQGDFFTSPRKLASFSTTRLSVANSFRESDGERSPALLSSDDIATFDIVDGKLINTTSKFKELIGTVNEARSVLLGMGTDGKGALTEIGSEAKLSANRITSSLKQAIIEGRGFEDVLVSIKNTLLSSLLDKALAPLNQFIGLAFDSFFGLFSKNENGAAFTRGRVMPFASGGVVTAPTFFPMTNGVGLMGEAGPEAIMPLRRGRGGRLGVEGAGHVSVNIHNNVGANVQTRQRKTQTGTDIEVLIDEAVARRISGGGAVSRALQNSFGLRPVAGVR